MVVVVCESNLVYIITIDHPWHIPLNQMIIGKNVKVKKDIYSNTNNWGDNHEKQRQNANGEKKKSANDVFQFSGYQYNFLL